MKTLIVEDEEALAKSMARILKSRGIAVDTAFSGAEARQRMAEVDYAVVLLDVRLPDESGYGLLSELRALRPDIAVVMVSGVDDPDLGKAAVEHGAHAYFVKPIGSTELYLAVVNALRRRSLELEYQGNLQRLEKMVAERAEQMAIAAHVSQDLEACPKTASTARPSTAGRRMETATKTPAAATSTTSHGPLCQTARRNKASA